ncbi:MAG: sulfatase [bacterium]
MKKILFAALMLTALAHAATKPNIIFILADDLGYTDLACYGSKYYETPNLDRMASQGVKFTHGYTCGANCQPTRAALMSGQYGARTGVYTVGSIERFPWRTRPIRPVENVQQLPLDKITLGQSMRRSGYKTALFGKWHLGDSGEHHPSKRGFDEAITSMGAHFDFTTTPHEGHPKDAYLADFLTNRATDFIRRNKENPFFLCLHHFGVHAPYQAKENWISHFKPKAAVGGHHDPTYAAMIASVDESVGRVLALLEELKLSENTLVIFSSDNGGVGGYKSAGLDKTEGITDNAPLRGGKGMYYEGGIRVPYIFFWKGKIEAGKVCEEPINSVDLYPTLLEIVGSTPPANYTLDGTSYLNLLTGKPTENRKPLYWHFPGYLGERSTACGVILNGDWKLRECLETGKLELYNLKNDVSEKNDLAAAQPEKAKELYAQLCAWRKEIKAPMPTPNTPSDKEEPSQKAAKQKKGGKKKNH